MEITDRRNTLKTRAFKSDASRPEKFEENATEPFTPFLMYYTPIALTTLSPEKITMPFTVFLPWAEQSTYIISFVSHVRTTLATLQALTSFWPYAHSSHLGFFWCGGGEGEGVEHSTYIISFVSRVGMTLATLQALTSFWPYAHSKHLGFIGMGGKQGNTLLIISFVSQVGTTLATLYTGSYFFLALCSQQAFRAYWGGGRGERGRGGGGPG